MGCILTIVGLALPRVLMFFLWLLTNWFSQAFDSVFWPVVGFLFMPYTTLAYMAAMLNNDHTLSGWWIGLLILGVLADGNSTRGGKTAVVRVHKRCKRV